MPRRSNFAISMAKLQKNSIYRKLMEFFANSMSNSFPFAASYFLILCR